MIHKGDFITKGTRVFSSLAAPKDIGFHRCIPFDI